MNSGSWLPLRQPSAPPSRAVWLLELAIASWAKFSPLRARSAMSCALLRDLLDLLGRCGRRQRYQDMRNVELFVRRRAVLALQILLDLARRDDDMRYHVALAQCLQRQFLAHRFAVLLVVDPLGRERGRQLVERNLVARRDVLQRAVQLFVRNGKADPLRPLFLDFLKYQPVQHLFLQNAVRRQRDLLILEALGHGIHLRVELALQDDAVVDHGGDAVEQDAARADIPCLCLRCGAQQEGRNRDQKNTGNQSHGRTLL